MFQRPPFPALFLNLLRALIHKLELELGIPLQFRSHQQAELLHRSDLKLTPKCPMSTFPGSAFPVILSSRLCPGFAMPKLRSSCGATLKPSPTVPSSAMTPLSSPPDFPPPPPSEKISIDKLLILLGHSDPAAGREDWRFYFGNNQRGESRIKMNKRKQKKKRAPAVKSILRCRPNCQIYQQHSGDASHVNNMAIAVSTVAPSQRVQYLCNLLATNVDIDEHLMDLTEKRWGLLL